MWRRFVDCLTVAENLCGVLAAIGLGAIMMIVASDVALRYGVGRPWPWAYDIVSIYLTVAVFYLALARTLREHGHINVDLLREHMSLRTRHAFDFLTCILAIVVFAILTVLTIKLTRSQYDDADVISSYVDWPTWLSTVFVPIGTVLTILRLLVMSVAHLSAIRSGRELEPSVGDKHPLEISTGE